MILFNAGCLDTSLQLVKVRLWINGFAAICEVLHYKYMHILKKILLGSALLPVLFVASLVFSSVTNTTPTAEASACRVGLTVGGVQVSDGSRSTKNETRTLTFTHEEAEDGIPIYARWKTDNCNWLGCHGSRYADLRIPHNSDFPNPVQTTIGRVTGEQDRSSMDVINPYSWGGDWLYELSPAQSGSFEQMSTQRIYDLQDNSEIQLWARANNDTCRTLVRFNIEPPEDYEIDVDISGPDRINEGETERFFASWTQVEGNIWGADRLYRWIVQDDGGNPIHDTFWMDYSNYGSRFYDFNEPPGDYRIVVIGRGDDGDFLAQDSAAMDVTVEENQETQEAVLEVRSQNPSSGVGMDFAGNSTHYSGRFETTETFRRDGNIDVRIYAEPSPNGQVWSHWVGCGPGSSGRECIVSVNGGGTKTITAVYDDPPVDDARINVRSSNPGSGVDINAVSGNLHDGDTSYKIEKSEDLSGELRAPSSEDGNDFLEWQGCDDENNGGRDCEISADTGESRTVTAVYESPPGDATLRVRSNQPDSGVRITRSGGNVDSDDTPYEIVESGGIDGELRAEDPAPNGNDFDRWSGCDDTNNGGRDCEITVAEDDTKTVTAIYDGGDPLNYGCTDPEASNYDSSADVDDGTCDYDNDDPDPDVGGCTDPDASNYDSDADYNDGSCEYGPDPDTQAVLEVNSTPFTGVQIDHNHSDLLGSPGTTNYTRGYDSNISNTWLHVHEEDDPITYNGTEYQIAEWQGCMYTTGDGDHICRVEGFDVGETRSITVVFEPVPEPVEGCMDPDAENYDADAEVDDGSCEYQAEINTFNASDPNLDFSANPPELHVDDQPFSLVWSTRNANSVTASGDWSGTYSRQSNSLRLPTS